MEKIVIHSIIKEKGESMKVIKRDGRVVEYDKEKIIIAIQKANNDVVATEQIGNKQIYWRFKEKKNVSWRYTRYYWTKVDGM